MNFIERPLHNLRRIFEDDYDTLEDVIVRVEADLNTPELLIDQSPTTNAVNEVPDFNRGNNQVNSERVIVDFSQAA